MSDHSNTGLCGTNLFNAGAKVSTAFVIIIVWFTMQEKGDGTRWGYIFSAPYEYF